ncbi:MAG TPA: SDR family oxidoreductase [Acidimicrobiales bacterium]|nr:SDR family oxidoreductase [Acidimicrobiales bacterium]
MGGVDGKVVVITGAGQGIGRGMAHHLGTRGATVVVAEWKAHRVDRVVSELHELGVEALGVECNILERDSIEAAVATTLDRYGRVDGLINNAHTFTAKVPLAEVGEADLDLNHGTVKGTLWAMQAVHPHMKAQGWGRIVNFVSAAGITGMAEYGAYNASKEAIRALTRTAAREWGRDGIVVNAIAPGAASKRGQEAAARAEAEYRDFLRDHPMGRQGDPEADIGPVALFLCSDGCRFLTGQTFMVDGGAFLFA